jgi:hypothetical protein
MVATEKRTADRDHNDRAANRLLRLEGAGRAAQG